MQRNYEKVLEVARRGILRAGSQEMPLRGHYANALACLGRTEEAAAEWGLVCEIAPAMTVDRWARGWASQLEDKSLVDNFAGGLLGLDL